jgi:hypothetical protein
VVHLNEETTSLLALPFTRSRNSVSTMLAIPSSGACRRFRGSDQGQGREAKE